MAKLGLMSILIATIVIPALYARGKNGKRGARKTVIAFAGFTLLWIVFSAYFYADLLGPVDTDPFKVKAAQ